MRTDHLLNPNAIPASGFAMVPRGRIKPRSRQPRTDFKREHIERIADSIRSLRASNEGVEGTGLLQPITVSWEPGAVLSDGSIKPNAKLLITYGETRYRASQVAGYTERDLLPVLIADAPAQRAFEQALIENVQRQGLTPIEEAFAVEELVCSEDLSIRRVAEELGQTHAWAQLRHDVARAPEDVRSILHTRPDALRIVQRIASVQESGLRRKLIAAAKKGVPYLQLENEIKEYMDRRDASSTLGRRGKRPSTNIGRAAAPGAKVQASMAPLEALRSVETHLDRTLHRLPEITIQAVHRRQMKKTLENIISLVGQIQEVL